MLTGTMKGSKLLVLAGVCLVVLRAGAVGAAAGTHVDDPAPHFTVALHGDGSATVSLTETFDLATAAERDAYQSLEADEAAKTELRSRFVDRMKTVAAAAAEETGREMSVSNPAIKLSRSTDGDTGLATVRVSWSNLAAVEDGTLVVAEPFASGFAPSHEFVLMAPDGFRIADASPQPATMGTAQANWAAGESLDGYRVVIEEAATQDDGPTDHGEESGTDGQPGFGLLGGVIGVIAVWATMRRRE